LISFLIYDETAFPGGACVSNFRTSRLVRLRDTVDWTSCAAHPSGIRYKTGWTGGFPRVGARMAAGRHDASAQVIDR